MLKIYDMFRPKCQKPPTLYSPNLVIFSIKSFFLILPSYIVFGCIDTERGKIFLPGYICVETNQKALKSL